MPMTTYNVTFDQNSFSFIYDSGFGDVYQTVTLTDRNYTIPELAVAMQAEMAFNWLVV